MTNEISCDDTPRCYNCGHQLDGDYCSKCGQAAVDITRPLATLITDFADGIISIEHSLWQTLRLLLLHPGRLTNEFINGRRIRYMSPIRLYLVASLFFFTVISWSASGVHAVFGDDDKNGAAPTAEESASAEADTSSGFQFSSSWFDDDTVARINADPDAFKDRFTSWIPRSMFALVPLCALLFKLVYFRHHRPYLDFLVFALHAHAVFYLTAAVCGTLSEIPHASGDIAAFLLFLTIPINVFRAQRQVFGGGRVKTFAKLFLVWNGYGVLQLVAIIALLALVVWMS